MGCDYSTRKNGSQCYCEYMCKYVNMGKGEYNCPDNLYECPYMQAAYAMEEEESEQESREKYTNKKIYNTYKENNISTQKDSDYHTEDFGGSGSFISTFICIDSLFSIKAAVCLVGTIFLLLLETIPISALIYGQREWQYFVNIAFASGVFMYAGMTVYQLYDGGKGGSCIPWIAIIATIVWRLRLNSVIQQICIVICIIGYVYIVIYGLVPLIFDLFMYLILTRTSLSEEQCMAAMMVAAILISILVGVIWVKTAYERDLWRKECLNKIKRALK